MLIWISVDLEIIICYWAIEGNSMTLYFDLEYWISVRNWKLKFDFNVGSTFALCSFELVLCNRSATWQDPLLNKLNLKDLISCWLFARLKDQINQKSLNRFSRTTTVTIMTDTSALGILAEDDSASYRSPFFSGPILPWTKSGTSFFLFLRKWTSWREKVSQTFGRTHLRNQIGAGKGKRWILPGQDHNDFKNC